MDHPHDAALKRISDAAARAVTKLDLRDMGLDSLPPELGGLSHLTALDLGGNRLRSVPPEVTQLTNLTALDLSRNLLGGLPPDIGQLVHLTDLNLNSNSLDSLPSEIRRLDSLTTVDLGGNRLRSLPPEVALLPNLANLNLSRNILRGLPPDIGQLANLRELNLTGNSLGAMPSEMVKLTSLAALNLTGNHLGSLPPEILQLTSLKTLDLSDNHLSSLPSETARLTKLTTLNLTGNHLSSLPSEIGRLTALTNLDLSHNQLRSLPPEIARLTALTNLDLSHNQLRSLPPEIARLTGLTNLDASHNELNELPREIARLTGLTNLDASHNELNELPAEITALSPTVLLHLDGNRLGDLVRKLVARGIPELFAYLRSLSDPRPQYEAKVLLVGEGKVGKSSVVAALRGEPFVPDRPSTHGIQVNEITLRHPKHPAIDQDLTLNVWDFGGQEVYRITHQFFFSRRALYLLVWEPRQGQEQAEVEGWLRRIHLRIGEEARVLLVATHADENRSSELDYLSLERQFHEFLVGQYRVDNKTGTGIEALRTAIANEAAKLPQMGEPVNRHWIAARDEILARPEPQIAYEDFVACCQSHGLDDVALTTFASLLHDLGHIIYYGDDDGLRDLIVLKPEWLTNAISAVMEDVPTRKAGGLLDHRRLKDIWKINDGNDLRPYHPYLLRLMEKFDVSYRLPEEAHTSLVGQLVPHKRPDLPWDSSAEKPTTRTLSLVCDMAEVAPGLAAWLIVRNHRFATGHHWRSGVFLRHARYTSEALFELVTDRQLMLTVRAPSPDLFFNILRDSLEELIHQRWQGLRYDLTVPCPTRREGGWSCPERFKLQNLLRRREAGKLSIECHECDQEYNISLLLTGFGPPVLPDQTELRQIREQMGQVAASVDQLEKWMADTAHVVRVVLKIISFEVSDCPRLFTLVPAEPARKLHRFWKQDYRLTLWCEHPGHEHALPKAEYTVSESKEWFTKLAPYLRLVVGTLHMVVPLAAAAAGVIPEEGVRSAEHALKLMEALSDRLPEPEEPQGSSADPRTQLSSAQGDGLRAFRELLFKQDPSHWFGHLRRFRDPSGDFLWICREHAGIYDPSLPVTE